MTQLKDAFIFHCASTKGFNTLFFITTTPKNINLFVCLILSIPYLCSIKVILFKIRSMQTNNVEIYTQPQTYLYAKTNHIQ